MLRSAPFTTHGNARGAAVSRKTDWSGMPENPERDGWHWLARSRDHCEPWPFRWVGGEEPGWCAEDGCDPDCADTSPDEMIRYWPFYLGPCLTSADLAERVEAERERCANEARSLEIPEDCSAIEAHGRLITTIDIFNRIRALGPTPAYDAAIKAAREDGMEAAAKWHDAEAKKAGTWRDWGGPSDKALQAEEAFHIEAAAAIRAAKDQPA